MRRSFAYWEEFLSHARDGYSRPVEHATRVHRSGEDAIAIQHHYTDIVTLHRDGRIELRNGGYYSTTTKQRLNSYSPAHLFTEDGDWVVPFEFDPQDPEPDALHRTILKPFHASDPGPEPVDDGVGCIAGTLEHYSYQSEEFLWKDPALTLARERQPGDFVIGQSERALIVERWRNGVIEYGSSHWQHYDREEERPYCEKCEGHCTVATYKQCPHCSAFKALHARWDHATNGIPYARSEVSERGYRQMCEHLEKYGTREAWQEAYITEFRAVREARKAHKAWKTRNHCSFHGGIEVTPSGYVPLRHKREHEKALRRSERERAQHNRRMGQLEAQHRKHLAQLAEQRRVKGMIAQALAESVVFEIDNLRPAWEQVKAQHREVAA